MAKINDEFIHCPQCGKLQSKKKYIEECCWDCGSIRPLPDHVILQTPNAKEVEPLSQDVEAGELSQSDNHIENGIDESKIRKMTEL